jgi:hypothetical protein
MKTRDGKTSSVTMQAGAKLTFAVWNDPYYLFNLKDPAMRHGM